jgi:hypothetical protein
MKQAVRFPVQVIIVAMTVFELALPACAHESGAHVHGRAALEVAIDGAAVQINLNSPLDNLLGFERAPQNKKELQAVETMALRLHQAENLFIFTSAAQCRVQSANLSSSLLSPDLLTFPFNSGKGADKNTDKNSSASRAAPSTSTTLADAHGELEATWHFQCVQPQALQGLDVRLFQVFPGLQRLDAAVAAPKGQSSAKLSPQSTRLKW